MGDRVSRSESSLLDPRVGKIPAKLCVFILIVMAAGTCVIVILMRRYVPRGKIRAGFRAEFLTRPGGYQGISRHYNFRFWPEPKQVDSSEIYRAISDGSVDVIDGLATDGRIRAYDLIALEDDKGFFTTYQPALLGFNQTHTLIMRRDHAERLGITTISHLARYVRWRRGGVPPLAGQF